ncbi:AMP-binding protein [Streptomyces sp. NPDC058092]|uniref:AMP-binding protein n=1 Tax=Streptomyces sp. NPDC058092 TaxID=3346336 RepID=UPI0036EE69D3
MLTFAELVEATAASADAGLVSGGEITSYRDLMADARRLASVLTDSGLAPGTRVALRFGDAEWAAYAVGYFATVMAGGVAVVLPPDATVRELRRMCGDVGVGMSVSTASAPEHWAAGTRHVSVSAARYGDSGYTASAQPAAALADIIFTSGTTGAPKGVAAHHGSLMETVRRYRERPRWAAVLGHGVSHATAIGTRQLLLSAVARSATLVCCVPFDAQTLVQQIERFRVATTVLPTACGRSLIRALEARPDADLSTWRKLRFVSDALSPDHHRKLAELLPGTEVINSYGLTEGGNAHLVVTQDDCHLGPGGRPAQGTEVRIMSTDGSWAEPGAPGCVCIRDSAQPLVYLMDPQATQATWRDGWTITGDIGFTDDTGRVHLTGRSDTLARIGGHTVGLRQVRRALEEHPSVRAAAVVVQSHSTLGQTLAAAVEWTAAGQDLGELRKHLTTALPAYAVPSPVVAVEELPTGSNGKTRHEAVAALIRARSVSGRPCRTETERTVAGVWQRVLGITHPVGPDDEYFALGGDSLAAVEIAIELEQLTHVDVDYSWFQSSPNLGALAAELELRATPGTGGTA